MVETNTLTNRIWSKGLFTLKQEGQYFPTTIANRNMYDPYQYYYW